MTQVATRYKCDRSTRSVYRLPNTRTEAQDLIRKKGSRATGHASRHVEKIEWLGCVVVKSLVLKFVTWYLPLGCGRAMVERCSSSGNSTRADGAWKLAKSPERRE
jgi:hypothetical protein